MDCDLKFSGVGLDRKYQITPITKNHKNCGTGKKLLMSPQTHTSKKVMAGKSDPNLYLPTEDKIDQRRMENRQRPLNDVVRILHPSEKKRSL